MLIFKLQLPQDQHAQLSSGLVGTVNEWALELTKTLLSLVGVQIQVQPAAGAFPTVSSV